MCGFWDWACCIVIITDVPLGMANNKVAIESSVGGYVSNDIYQFVL